MILHGGFSHIFMNMLTLSMIGFACEHYLGKPKYVILLVLGAIGGNTFSAVFQNKCGIAIGASTSLMTVLAFSIIFFLVNFESMGANKLCYLMYLIMIASSQLFGSTDSSVDNYGHAGGFFAGVILTLCMYETAYKNSIVKPLLPCVLTIGLAIFAILFYLMMFQIDTRACGSV